MTFQGKLTTKLDKFSVNDSVVELQNNVDKEQLNHIVRNLLKQINVDEDIGNRTFDFLVGGRFLKLTVDKHLELYSDDIDANEILSEKLVEIEYFLSFEPPKPLDAVPHEDWVSCVDANEHYIISGSYDNSIRIFSIKDRKNIITVNDAHEKPVTKVRWLTGYNGAKKNEMYFVSCGHDEVSILRKFNSKSLRIEVVFVFKGHNRSVNCVDSSDDLIATGSFDKSLRIWSSNLEQIDDESTENDPNADSQKKKRQKIKSNDKSLGTTSRTSIMTLTDHQESITGVKWLGSCNEFNSLATCSMDRTICIWDVEVGESKRRLLSSKPLLGIDFSNESNLILAASCDKHVRLWDVRAPDNGTAKTIYTSHSAWVSSVAFANTTPGSGDAALASSNNFISGGYDNLVKLWDLRSPKACLFDMIGHHDKVLDVNWRNSDYVLSGSADATLKVFATNK